MQINCPRPWDWRCWSSSTSISFLSSVAGALAGLAAFLAQRVGNGTGVTRSVYERGCGRAGPHRNRWLEKASSRPIGTATAGGSSRACTFIWYVGGGALTRGSSDAVAYRTEMLVGVCRRWH
jgi:hypothetical protein